VLLDRYDAVLLDLDGVVYAGAGTVAHAVDALAAIRRRGVPVAFVTNNAARTPSQVVDRLRAAGVDAEADEVATSAQAAARLLSSAFPAGARVLVVGGDGLLAAVTEAGLCPVATADAEPVAVVQGYSPDVGWRQLAVATVAVRAGAHWVATNLDLTIPSERGVLPGNGTLVAAVQAAAGRPPDEVAGKPARPLHDEAVLRTGGSRPLVVGDRLDTDIEGANAVGADSLLVLTGVTKPSELVLAPRERRPTWVAADLRALEMTAPAADRTGWSVEVRDDEVVVTGDGDPLDALRALLTPCWDLVDADRVPQVVLPAVLASWWC
jgi:HAD superfamily hydrolase (TIGR01450 family)